MLPGPLLIAGQMVASIAIAGGTLGIPDTIEGYPANVGFLILGHSTSAQGAYPAKLVATLNHASHTPDGRHYMQFNAITGGDGGLLWSIVSVAPDDTRYHRATASQGVAESAQPQWCEDASAVRWSCRRAKVEHLLSGAFPIPATGTCTDISVGNACRQPATQPCTWYDRSLPLAQNPVTQSLAPHDCWQRMDYRIALVQDTSNRSWPIDDYDVSGAVDAGDLWLASRIRSRALPCPASSGVVGSSVDWDCDLALDVDDAELAVYAGWLRELADDLLDATRYGDDAVDAVVITQKPTEMGQCQLWPAAERSTCMANPHAVRTPAQIASTPDRPLDHYYLPTVYWEYRVIETLFATPGLDPRILATTPADARAMSDRSAQCYAIGIAAGDWRMPAAAPGRPTTIAADDTEIDSGGGANANTVGCMVIDHVHHNDNGGWMMADVWYDGLSAPLWAGLPDALFADQFE
jgi:hypothetical protein